MVLVLVSVCLNIADDGLLSPSGVFFFFVTATFLLSAVLHPQEFACVIYGIVYFLAIPTMSMLMIVYALVSMHVVSWGTREVPREPEDRREGGAVATATMTPDVTPSAWGGLASVVKVRTTRCRVFMSSSWCVDMFRYMINNATYLVKNICLCNL